MRFCSFDTIGWSKKKSSCFTYRRGIMTYFQNKLVLQKNYAASRKYEYEIVRAKNALRLFFYVIQIRISYRIYILLLNFGPLSHILRMITSFFSFAWHACNVFVSLHSIRREWSLILDKKKNKKQKKLSTIKAHYSEPIYSSPKTLP